VPVYESKTGAGASFQVKSGSMTVTNSTPTPHLTMGYLVEIANPVISLTGTTKVSGQDKILIGQGCSAVMSLAGNIPDITFVPASSPNGYDWTVAGLIFDNYTASASTGKVMSCVDYDGLVGGGNRFKKASPRRWIWYQPINSAEVACSSNIQTLDGVVIGSVTESKIVNVETPFGTAVGVPDYIEISASKFLMATMFFQGNIQTHPQYFTINNGQTDIGTWHFVQIITPNRTYTWSDKAPTTDPHQGERGLDTTYPYNGPYPANGQIQTATDSPGTPLISTKLSATINEPFEMYTMYRPPLKTGMPSDWVSFVNLHLTEWKWKVSVVQTGSNWTTYTSVPTLQSPTLILYDVPSYAHPEWTTNSGN
jgi:hypothetical protein